MSAFRVGDRVVHTVFKTSGRVVEVPAVFAGTPMPGTIRVLQWDGPIATTAWAGEEMWRPEVTS